MHARARLMLVSIVAGVGLLVPAGLAVAGTSNPGNACSNTVPNEKNPNCGNRQVPRASDADHDGVAKAADNCPNVFNPNQIDSDHDGHGEPCDHLLDAGGPHGDGTCDAPKKLCGAPTYSDHDGDGRDDASEDTPPPSLSL